MMRAFAVVAVSVLLAALVVMFGPELWPAGFE